jgi:hypothetical protein
LTFVKINENLLDLLKITFKVVWGRVNLSKKNLHVSFLSTEGFQRKSTWQLAQRPRRQ